MHADIHIKVFCVNVFLSLRYIPMSGIADSYVMLCLTFEEMSNCLPR